ncbi:MAG: helix-turn-helix transcriptional regulator [Pseudomonadota bacterium]
MRKTNFDRHLEEQLQYPGFAARFERPHEEWDVALQIVALRRQVGLSQQDLAKLLKTSQQHISRLESPGYEGHSLSTLRRVAEALNARLRIVFEPEEKGTGTKAAESRAPYSGEVDKGVVAMFLKMSPEERLQANDNAARAIQELRDAYKQQRNDKPGPERST